MSAMMRTRIGRLIEGRRYGRVARRWTGARVRRMFDLLAASIGLILLFPFFLFVVVFIKFDSPGPIFYWGLRVGKHGRPFRMLKFRTMYEKTDSHTGPRITAKEDPRITAIGHWLRDTKLNELPQLWNVLKGEMSLVGPRPEDPVYVAHWPEETRQLLLSVRPGMTSPASVVYRNEEEILAGDNVEEKYLAEILPDKLRLDSRYVRRRTILGDLDVLFWTAIVLIPLVRRRQIPDEHLLWGPVAQFASRYFSWFLVDALVVFSVVTIVGVFWRAMGPLDVGMGIAFLLAVLVTIVFSLMNYVFGLSRIHWSKAQAGYVLALFASAMVATIVLLLVNQLLPAPLPPALLMAVGLFAWLGFVLVRYRLRLVTGAAQHWLNMRPETSFVGERVLIVGSGVVGRFAASLLNHSEILPTFTVVGGVDDNERRRDAQIGGFRVLGTTADIVRLVKKYEIGVIVFAISECGEAARKRILDQCAQTAARVVFLPDIVETIQTQFAGLADKEPPLTVQSEA